MGSLIKGLERKLSTMKQEFRIIRSRYEHGDAIKMKVAIEPRGPRGFTGNWGDIGPPGVQGMRGGVGVLGILGLRTFLCENLCACDLCVCVCARVYV